MYDKFFESNPFALHFKELLSIPDRDNNESYIAKNKESIFTHSPILNNYLQTGATPTAKYMSVDSDFVNITIVVTPSMLKEDFPLNIDPNISYTLNDGVVVKLHKFSFGTLDFPLDSDLEKDHVTLQSNNSPILFVIDEILPFNLTSLDVSWGTTNEWILKANECTFEKVFEESLNEYRTCKNKTLHPISLCHYHRQSGCSSQ